MQKCISYAFQYNGFPNLFGFHLAGPLRESRRENDHPEEDVAEETETRMVHKGKHASHFGMECVDFSVDFIFDIRLCHIKIYQTKCSECLPILLALMHMSSWAVWSCKQLVSNQVVHQVRCGVLRKARQWKALEDPFLYSTTGPMAVTVSGSLRLHLIPI